MAFRLDDTRTLNMDFTSIGNAIRRRRYGFAQFPAFVTASICQVPMVFSKLDAAGSAETCEHIYSEMEKEILRAAERKRMRPSDDSASLLISSIAEHRVSQPPPLSSGRRNLARSQLW